MYRLTDRRLEQAREILDRYRRQLHEHHDCNVTRLEFELRETWDIGYQEMKDVMLDIVRHHPNYRLLALKYMEDSNPSGGVVSEFKSTLAKAYEIRSYDSAEAESARKRFWEKALSTEYGEVSYNDNFDTDD